jgi:tmRNA-binding protein
MALDGVWYTKCSKILEGQIVELEKENKELKTIKEAFAKLKDAFAKLEAENVQLRVLELQPAPPNRCRAGHLFVK